MNWLLNIFKKKEESTNLKPAAPQEKITPTNDGLLALFDNAQKVVIKKGGVRGNMAITNEVLVTITAAEDIARLCKLMEIKTPEMGFRCLCPGDHAIEVYGDGPYPELIGFHHGTSLHYSKWNSDADLTQSEELLKFFASVGLTNPLDDYKVRQEKAVARKKKEEEWQKASPHCFTTFFRDMNQLNNNFFPALLKELNQELPDRHARIVALLASYGKSDNYWTNYPIYEDVPAKILWAHELKDIIAAYEGAEKNELMKRGLGRFLCSFEFKKARAGKMDVIPRSVAAELLACYEALGEERGITEMEQLHKETGRR